MLFKDIAIVHRGQHQIQMAEVQGSILIVVTFCCWIFCFQVVKPPMPLLPIICVCEKLELISAFIKEIGLQSR